MTNSNQNGRSMIEMLGVLAIIGVLSVGGIAGYSKAMMKVKTNKTIDQIAMTVTNIRTLYAQQQTYQGLATTNAYKMGVVDDAMKGTAEGTLKNAFNGWVEIGTAQSGAVGEKVTGQTGAEGNKTNTYAGAFLVTFGGLPREACVSIATNDWGSNYSSGLLGIGTGSEKAAAGSNAAVTAGAKDVQCGVNGGLSTASNDVEKSACAHGNTSAAFSVKDAAAGCSCASANTCFVTFKYY